MFTHLTPNSLMRSSVVGFGRRVCFGRLQVGGQLFSVLFQKVALSYVMLPKDEGERSGTTDSVQFRGSRNGVNARGGWEVGWDLRALRFLEECDRTCENCVEFLVPRSNILSSGCV